MTLIYGRIGRKSKERLPMAFVAACVNLPDEIRPVLSKNARSRALPARQVQRAKIILLAADGHNNMQISKTGRAWAGFCQQMEDAVPQGSASAAGSG